MRKSVIITKKHEGKWVAFSPKLNKVVGYSDDVQSLVKKHGRDNIVYTKVLRSDISYAFISR